MSSNIVSSPLALPFGAVVLCLLTYGGYHYRQNLEHPSIWFFLAYLWFSAAGIIFFDILRRTMNYADRKRRVRFDHVWRAAGFTWHAVGALMSVIVAVWSTRGSPLVTSPDASRDQFLSFALNLSFIVAVPIMCASLLTQTIQIFRLRSVRLWIVSRKGVAGLLAFTAFAVPTILLTWAIPSASYDFVRLMNDEVPSTVWVAILGSAVAAFAVVRAF